MKAIEKSFWGWYTVKVWTMVSDIAAGTCWKTDPLESQTSDPIAITLVVVPLSVSCSE